MRCFNTYKPLEGPLMVEVQKLCDRVKYKISEAYVVDGSTRSSHSNAYFLSLLWVKKLVIYDTLLKRNGGEETDTKTVMAVVAHEISHWQKNHTNKMLILQLVLQFCEFQLLALCMFSKNVFTSFGFFGEQPVVIGFILFSGLLAPVSFFLEVFINMISRRFEYEADAGALDLGFDNIDEALITISHENKQSPYSDWLYSMCYHSHPTLLQRLEEIDKKKMKTK